MLIIFSLIIYGGKSVNELGNKLNTKSKNRILFIGPIPEEVGGPRNGGVATYCWELAHQANKNGYNVYIWSDAAYSFNDEDISIISWNFNNKLKLFFFGVIYYLMSIKILKKLEFLTFKQKIIIAYRAYLLKDLIKIVNPDIIHVLHLLDNINFSLFCLRSPPPVVVTEHAVGLVYEYQFCNKYDLRNNQGSRSLINAVLKKTDCIISVSKFSQKSFLKNFSIPNNLITKYILNPIDISKLPILNKNDEKKKLGLDKKKVVAFIGVHLPIERKGLDILLETFLIDDYLRNNCLLLIITNDEARIYASKFIKSNKIDGLALGPQPWDKLIGYFNSSDVFVMPSRLEGIGLVYYEALLAGVPIVGFHSSVKELEEVLGIYIGERFNAALESKIDLAEKIKKVLNTDFDRNLLRKRTIDNLSWEVKFPEFDSVYKKLVIGSTEI